MKLLAKSNLSSVPQMLPKKGGSWNTYSDIRALKAQTVTNFSHFAIPGRTELTNRVLSVSPMLKLCLLNIEF